MSMQTSMLAPLPTALSERSGSGATAAVALDGLRVLLVEDEQSVGLVIKRMLDRLRCQATVAEDPFAALSVFRPELFDVVLTDVVMPGMTGFDLVDCLKERAPALRYLYMSGYPAVGAVAELMGIARPLLCKPFLSDELAQALTRVQASPACVEVFGSWPRS